MIRGILLLVIFQLGFIYLNYIPNPSRESSKKSEREEVVQIPKVTAEFSIASKDIDPRVKAFLHLITYTEGTDTPNGYRTQYTGTLFSDYSQHPDKVICAWAIVHEVRRRLCSTAAGAHQFITPTWERVAAIGGLKDFSPINQDKGAIILLKQTGSYPLLLKNPTPSRKDIELAIKKANSTWASFPYSPHGQPTHSMKKTIDKYFELLDRYKKRQ